MLFFLFSEMTGSLVLNESFKVNDREIIAIHLETPVLQSAEPGA
jgi:hypothetical protein